MSEAGIPARTADRALLDRERALRAGIRRTPGIVLVDEAGTIGTRTLGRLADAVARGRKARIVGDEAQLPAVAAGAAYANLLEREQAVHSLETPRRFVTATGEPDLAEARALALLRSGTLEGATRYLQHREKAGAIQVLHRKAALEAATAWHAAQAAAGADRARIALVARTTHSEPSSTSARAPQCGAGRLDRRHGIASAPLAVGDVVACRRNDTRLGATNGTRGRITSISRHEQSRRPRRISGRSCSRTPTRARVGWNTPTPVTGHLAQGATFDAAMVVAPPHHHTQQWGYTALSRSRAPTQLVVLTESTRDQPSEHAAPVESLDARDALTRLAMCMTRDDTETERSSPAALPLPAPRRSPRHIREL